MCGRQHYLTPHSTPECLIVIHPPLTLTFTPILPSSPLLSLLPPAPGHTGGIQEKPPDGLMPQPRGQPVL